MLFVYWIFEIYKIIHQVLIYKRVIFEIYDYFDESAYLRRSKY